MVEEAYALDGAGGAAGAGAAGAWHTLQHAEQQQAALASALLGTVFEHLSIDLLVSYYDLCYNVFY